MKIWTETVNLADSVVSLTDTFPGGNYSLEDSLFFDIETTGFKAEYCFIYMIGCATFAGSEATITLFFADTRSDEKAVLEAFGELLAHSFVELCDNAFQRLCSLNEVVVLSLKERVSLHEIFVILDGVNVNVAEFLDLFLNLRDLFLHRREFFHIFVTKRLCIDKSDLVLFPHVIDLRFDRLGILFFLSIESVYFFIERSDTL